VPNKTTALLKDAVLKAAETAGGGEPDGLVNYLVVQAKQNPAPFMTLLGKVLPTQVSGEDGHPRHHPADCRQRRGLTSGIAMVGRLCGHHARGCWDRRDL
jgi:hypothetical protein